jgi:hypothetical protein
MNLRPKTTRFIIEALNYRIEAYQERLKAEDLDEDEESDITNDSEFLASIRTEMAKTLKKSDSVETNSESEKDSSLSDDGGLSLQELVKSVITLSIDQRLLLVDAITESIRQEVHYRKVQDPSENSVLSGTVAVIVS